MCEIDVSIKNRIVTELDSVNWEIRFLRKELRKFQVDVNGFRAVLAQKLEHRRALRDQLQRLG